MKERRKYKRINIDIDITVDKSNAIIRSKAKNIGAGGICLISEIDFPVSTIINLIFHLPVISKTIGVTGEIVWNEYLVNDDVFYCGVMFTKIPKRYEELLQEYVANGYFDIRHNKKVLELLDED